MSGEIVWRLDLADAQALRDLLQDWLEVWDDDDELGFYQTDGWLTELSTLIEQHLQYQALLQPPLDNIAP